MKDLLIVRGISGSGKTTFAELLGGTVFSADDYFMKNGNYEFDANRLGAAHLQCQANTQSAMQSGVPKIIVANTFTTEWEMKPYFTLAKNMGYRIFTVIMENRHGGTNVHDVPATVLNKQKERFNIKL